MRKKIHDQLPLMDTQVNHPRAREFEGISRILDANPIICEMVLHDLTKGVNKCETGAKGMTADQVLRAAIVKQTEVISYKNLAFHIIDSRCYSRFCRIGFTHKGLVTFKSVYMMAN